jgi:NAD(P)-dependent dehydrogenase (short-subunit alcohol dehydrogenase family)
MVISGRNQEKGDTLAAELRQLGAIVEFIPADVRKDNEVRALVDQAVKRFGRVDVAVNNAGTEGQPGMLVDQTAETYAATFDTNVLGTLFGLKHELRVMLAQKSGSIVNISSTFGKFGGAGASIYAASKHAVEGLTQSAALEGAAAGVRVNAVAPGPIETGMLNRFVGHNDSLKARTGGDRAGGGISRVRQGFLHDGANSHCGRRQNRRLSHYYHRTRSTLFPLSLFSIDSKDHDHAHAPHCANAVRRDKRNSLRLSPIRKGKWHTDHFQSAFSRHDGLLGSGRNRWPRGEPGSHPLQQCRRCQQLRQTADQFSRNGRKRHRLR